MAQTIPKFVLLLFSCSVMSNSLQPHGLQHARLPCPSPSPGACSCPLSQSCHPTISSSVIPFSSCLQSFPASGSFPMSRFLTLGGQSIGAIISTSLLLMNTQDWFPLGLTGLISLQSKGLSRVFFSTSLLLLLQSIGAIISTSLLLMNTQDWFPLGLTGLISSQSKGLSRVFFSSSKASTLWY